MRVALAALLFSDPDLLLLDEPTNHLDLEASLWLEDYLRKYKGTILLVSHDRDLLNRVVTEILHLEHQKLKLYTGGYDRFERTRRMQLELTEKSRKKQEAQRAHMQKYIDRFRYKASKAKQAQSRIKMLARMEPISAHLEERGIAFDFPNPGPLSPPIFATDEVSVGYDGKAVLSGLSLRLDHADRIALIGANGNGKSTLIKLLADKLPPLSGHIQKPSNLKVGYFAQHQGDELDHEGTPVAELSKKLPQATEQQVRKHLGRFGFTQERSLTRVSSLSGGEKARLLFALMTVDSPNILLLDEPTNHLDVDSRQALIEALNRFEGAVVIVSHDPHILELVTDRFWLVQDGKVTPFDGDMADYRKHLLGKQETRKKPVKKSDLPIKSNLDHKAQRALKKRLTLAEGRVNKLAKQREALLAALGRSDAYAGDGEKAKALQTNLKDTEYALAAAEADWMDIQELLDKS